MIHTNATLSSFVLLFVLFIFHPVTIVNENDIWSSAQYIVS